MKIIPKEEIDRENDLRFDLLEKKNAFARLVFEQSKTIEGFIGTPEQIAELEDGESKDAIIAGYSECVAAAMKINAEAQWFEDVQRIVEALREQEENNNKDEEAK